MQKYVYYIINLLFVFVLYTGIVKNDAYFQNYALYFAWFTSIVGIIAAFYVLSKKELTIKSHLEHNQIIDYRLDTLFDFSVAALFLFYSYYVTGLLYLAYTIIFSYTHFKAMSYLKDDNLTKEKKKMRFF